MTNTTLYYVYDPMCSWCYAFSSNLDIIYKEFSKTLNFKYILGGLAKDNENVMDSKMQHAIMCNWQNIQKIIPSLYFNYDFWQLNAPRRSTYPSCRAIIACRKQKLQLEPVMLKLIQKAYYQDAKNPSDNEVLIALAADLNLDVKKFSADLVSCQEELSKEIKFARSIGANSFPSVVLNINKQYHNIPINYTDARQLIQDIKHTLFNY